MGPASAATKCNDGQAAILIVPLHVSQWPQSKNIEAKAALGSALYEVDTYVVSEKNNKSTAFPIDSTLSCDGNNLYVKNVRFETQTFLLSDVIVEKDIGAQLTVVPPNEQPSAALKAELQNGEARFIKTI